VAGEVSRVVRTRVRDPGGGRRFSFGSGHLLAPGRVLTAAHVLVPPGGDPPATVGQRCEILCCSESNDVWLPAEALWVKPDLDVAVLGVEAGQGLVPMRWGRVEGDQPILWSAVGFPFASLDDAGRQPEHAWGETSAITQGPARKLGLTVNSRHARPSGDTSGLAGLSGAAVICDQRLVGVVIEDPAGYEGSLAARRLEAVADDPALHDALGVRPVLEVVSGRTLEPRLRDLRVVLPACAGSFTGRDAELAWLAETDAGPVVVTQALAGLGGVGKTALALEYAHRRFYAEHAVDLVWWFTANDRLSLTSAMTQLYEQLTDAPAGQDSALSAARLRNWLENTPYRWLVVFDNADDAGVLADLVPRAGRGQVLITSRRSDWAVMGATVRRLGVLPPDESAALLSRITERDDHEGARLLATELGGLPVALRQAGAFITKTGWDCRRYLKMLRTRPLRLHTQDLAGVGTTMVQVWESSLDQVVRSGRYGSLAPHVLGVLAYFAAEDIPRQLLAAPAVDGEAIFGGDALEVALALVGLADYSLISLGPDVIGLHRLIQRISQLHLKDHGTAADYVDTAVRLLRALLAQRGRTADHVNRLLPHIQEATSHAVGLSTASEHAIDILNVVAHDRLQVGQLDVTRSLLERAMKVAVEELGPEHPQTLRTRHNLGHWLAAVGRIEEALVESSILLDDQSRVLGLDHPDTLSTRGNLIRWLGEAGRVEEALAKSQPLLEDHCRVLGLDHLYTLTTRSNLAHWFGEAGRLEEALMQFQALLVDQLRVLGPDHPDTLETRHHLACWLGNAGRVEDAVAQSQAVLADQLRVLGPDHPNTLRTRTNLAWWLGEAGQVEEAVAQYEILLVDQLRAIGADHPHTLSTRYNLAHRIGDVGWVDGAVARFRTLLMDCLRVLGPNHPHTLATRHDLAWWLGEAGQVEEAIIQFETLVPDQLRVLGSDHPDTLETHHHLAHWLAKTGKIEEAVAHYEVLLDDQLRVLGTNHPDTRRSRRDLAYWRVKAGEVDGAG
jgi:tetratricopeptide (TPR) repeat protein